MNWLLEPQLDNNGLEVGIGGLRVGWLVQQDEAGQPLYFPGTTPPREVRVLVSYEHGLLLAGYLNSGYDRQIRLGQDAREERLEQPYLDQERIPPAEGTQP
jgi:hypothetical protein